MAALQVTTQKEQVPIEWKPCVTGEENAFTIALQQQPINKSTVEDLKQVLKLAMLKVGVRANNLPKDEEKAVLIEHIISNYGNHTPMEIKLAFDMAISGKLDDLDAKGNVIDLEVNCYENFSCLYFSKIMNSYRRWARQTHNQLKKDYPKMIAEKFTLDDEEKAEWMMEWKQKDDIILELIPLIFYDWMSDKNLIKITAKQKWEYTERATAQIKADLFNETQIVKTNNDAYIAYSKFCNMEKDGFTGEYKGRIVNRAKRLIIFDYLKDKIS
jgi:hypothetical protein